MCLSSLQQQSWLFCVVHLHPELQDPSLFKKKKLVETFQAGKFLSLLTVDGDRCVQP